MVCEETRRRILLSIWAYAYEFEGVSLVPDDVFDQESRKVDLTISTARPDMDTWFKNNFHPDTGMWIRNHPELHKIKRIYDDLY